MTTRRAFLEQSALAAVGLSMASTAGAASAATGHPTTCPTHRVDIRRPPDRVTAQTDTGYSRLAATGAGTWERAGIAVSTVMDETGALAVALRAPASPVQRLHLRWHGVLRGLRVVLGDAWERGYGDLEWRGIVPDRVMPWYVLTWDGRVTDAYGVRTGAHALCFWQLDRQGLSLWADVRSGGMPVQLGARTLAVCQIVSRAGLDGETPFAALHAFCRTMCRAPRLPRRPIYGANDWYWNYGRSSADKIRAETELLLELSPTDGNRPFSVIDDGWQPARGANAGKTEVGRWDRGNERFPDLPGLVADIRRLGADPGIWFRPLRAPVSAPERWRLGRERSVLDPTVPEVRRKIAADIGRLTAWGFELIKHDYTTFDIFGRWGFQMGSRVTDTGWTFAEGPIRTSAEVIDELYRTIRAAAGETLVDGCNTVSHLSAGRFELCRIGDDTSGTEWARTRRMGVNTLAFRGPQHGAFYTADPDCIGVTAEIPWALNRQWLDLLARSGTVLFASLAPDAVGPNERRDLRAAFATAATPQSLGHAEDWRETTWPTRWSLMGADRAYDWIGPEGIATV